MASPRHPIIPTAILLGVLSVVGLVLYLWTDVQVFWGGFFAMMVFYAAIFYIGAYAANLRKSDDLKDVMLAGRSIPLWIGIFTMGATWVGGGYINGTAEYTQSWGLVWVQAPWGYALSLIVGGLFFARKMRRYEFRTMLDPLRQRFGKRVAAMAFLPALTGEIFWTAAILTALGTTFGTVLGFNFEASILLSAAIAIAYTALGGLWAVALTDILQTILLMLGLIIVLPFALDYVGGWDHAWENYKELKGPAASLLPSQEALGDSYWSWWDTALLLICGGIPWQVYFQRVLSSKNERVAMNLSLYAGLFCLVAAIPAVMIGVIGDVAAHEGTWAAVGAGNGPATSAEVLPYVVRWLSNPVVATIGLGAIAAAVMSSVDSSILSASSMATWNVYKPLIRPEAKEAELTKILQRCIWIVGIAATLLALQVKSVYALWYLCSDFVYCLLFPLLVTALFDRKANTYGAVAGFLVALTLRFGGGDPTLGIPTILPYGTGADGVVTFPFKTLAMVAGLLTILLVSRLTAKHLPPRPLTKWADGNDSGT
ncbi:MAG: sodium:solute symporter family protein [Bacteroidota bacterium]